MAHSFKTSAPIVLKPGSDTVPYTFTFAAASSATANDGSIPFGTTISDVAVTVLDASGNDKTSEILVAESNTTTVISVTLQYPSTTGAGTYTIRMLLTLSSGAIMEFSYEQLIAEASSFISYDDLKLEMGISKTDDDDLLKKMAITSEALWDLMTNKTWFAATSTEYQSGTGTTDLFLDNYPVTSISRIGSGKTGAISVTNSNTYTYATVSVNSTNVVLNYNGTESTLALATYTTMTTLVAAINALGNGWSASVLASQGDMLSSVLLESYGSDCINGATVDLNIPNEFLYDYGITPETGMVYKPSGWSKGFRNIVITYTSGYTDVTLPNHIRQIMVRQACHWYRQAKGKNWDYSSIDKLEGGTVNFAKTKDMNLLPDFIKLAEMNRKTNV